MAIFDESKRSSDSKSLLKKRKRREIGDDQELTDAQKKVAAEADDVMRMMIPNKKPKIESKMEPLDAAKSTVYKSLFD